MHRQWMQDGSICCNQLRPHYAHYAIIGSDNGLSPKRGQATVSTDELWTSINEMKGVINLTIVLQWCDFEAL